MRPLAEGQRAPGTTRRWRDLPRDMPPSSSPPAAGPESSSPDLKHKQEELLLMFTSVSLTESGIQRGSDSSFHPHPQLNLIYQKLMKRKHELLLVFILLRESEFTGWWRQTAGGADSSVAAIKPPQKKRTPRDDVIKRAPVKAQTMENHVENMMEIWHLLMWGRLQPPHPPLRSDAFFTFSHMIHGWHHLFTQFLHLTHTHTHTHTLTHTH